MQRVRKILAVLTALCVAAGAVVWPADTKEVKAVTFGDFEYTEFTDGTVEISKYSGAAADLVIPNEISGKTVSSIGDGAFRNCSGLINVTIPSKVESIKGRAFRECRDLVKVDFLSDDASGLKYIGDNAFFDCTKLREIHFGSGMKLQSVGNYAFRGCEKLTGIDLGEAPDMTSIGDGTFQLCSSLTQITLPVNVTSIGIYAFYNCQSLTRMELPAGVTSIGDNAFQGCTGLTELNLPSGITSISNNAFQGCTGLTKLNLPSGITSISGNAFQGCTGLTELNLPSGVTSIESAAFSNCTGLERVVLSDSLTSIKEQAFSGCRALKNIDIPAGVKDIGVMAFHDCTSLKQVNLPSGIAKIENNAFGQCSSLTDVYYDGTQEQWEAVSIGTEGNEALQNAVIHFSDGSTINGPAREYEYEDLGDGTVAITKYNGSDTEVEIPAELDGMRVAEVRDFGISPIRNVTIPSGVKNVDVQAFGGCSSLVGIYVAEGNETYASKDGVLFNKAMTELVRCPLGRSGDYIVPDGIVRIGNLAFNCCSRLTEVTMKNEVKEIGYQAFSLCGMTQVTLPERVTNMGEYVFSDCQRLKEIRIPKGIEEIDETIFWGCMSLEKIELPEGVIVIRSRAFTSCPMLKAVTIPESVIGIEVGIFSTANSELSDVYYGGTKDQWEKISVPDADTSLTISEKIGIPAAATIHFKEDPAPVIPPEETVLPEVADTRQDLEQIKSDKPFSLDADFGQYMSPDQINTVKGYLYTWLAEINYAYQYPDSGSSRAVRRHIMKKVGIDPDGSFVSGMEQAVTHISIETKYGPKIFEITMDLGRPDSSGNLYPSYGALHYEVLEKGGIPSGVPTAGEIGKVSGAELEPYIKSVSSTLENTLRSTYQWESMRNEQTAGVLTDMTVTEIIGNKNGSFSGGVFHIYEAPLESYSKKVTISGSASVQVYIYDMHGNTAASIINNQPSVVKTQQTGGASGIQIKVDADTNEKVIFLSGNDYYIKLCGEGAAAEQTYIANVETGSRGLMRSDVAAARIRRARAGGMTYTVEEVANDEVCRTVQFLEKQLLEDMMYEGYIFRPLNIDRDLYALRVQGGAGQDMVYADSDSYRSAFRMVQGLSISQEKTSMNLTNTIQLNASIYPLDASNPKLQWRSDNESVVTVDQSGRVNAVGAGSATITVLTKDGSFLKQFCIFDVSGGPAGEGGSGGSTGGSGSGGSTGGSGSGGTASGSTGGFGGDSTSADSGKQPVVEKLHYVVQFDTNGGTKLSRKTMTLLADDSPGIMPKVQRRDYVFSGWYTRQDGGEQVKGDKPLGEAATLYARWTKAEAPSKAPSPELVSKKKGKIRISFQKISGAAGYEIEYSTSKKFAASETKEMKSASGGKSIRIKTLSGLKAGKKYFVRMRAYSVDSAGNKLYGAYSSVKRIKPAA